MQSYPACRECPYHDHYSNRNCISKRNADIKDRIKSLNAENEELKRRNQNLTFENENLTSALKSAKAEIERLQGYNENLLTANTALSNEVFEAKSEAIKEFAERLDDLLNNEGGCDSEPGTWARGWDDAITRAIEINSNLLTELTERKEDEGK